MPRWSSTFYEDVLRIGPYSGSKGLTKQEFVNSLLFLNEYVGEDRDYLSLDIRGSQVILLTRDIILEGYNFGKYKVHVDFSEFLRASFNGQYIKITSEIDKGFRYCHPHVSNDGSICLGEASRTYDKCFYIKDIISILEYVFSLLETYNPSSPFMDIQGYLPTACDDCGSPTPSNELHQCQRCMNKYCTSCNMAKCACGRYICRECAVPSLALQTDTHDEYYEYLQHSENLYHYPNRNSRFDKPFRLMVSVCCPNCARVRNITVPSTSGRLQTVIRVAVRDEYLIQFLTTEKNKHLLSSVIKDFTFIVSSTQTNCIRPLLYEEYGNFRPYIR